MEDTLGMLAVVRALAALGVTLGVLLGTAWLAKRYGWAGALSVARKTETRIRILEKTALTAQTSLMLVEEGDRQHLLAVNAAQTTVIHSRTVVKAGAKPNAIKSGKAKS